MCKRSLGLGLLAALVGGLGGGCKKSAPAPLLLPQAPPPVETVASIHWLGKQRLAADTNAASLMAIWNLPESKALETQTLDRLALGLLGPVSGAVSSLESKVPSPEAQPPAEGNPKAEARSPKEGRMPKDKAIPHPADASPSNAPALQASKSPAPPPLTGSRPNTQNSKLKTQNSPLPGPAALLRPLLEDLLEQESFLKVRQATNQPGELALAIKLSEERARLWQTNLATLLESLTSSRVAAAPARTNGWQLQFQHQGAGAPGRQPITRTFDVARVGEWTVVGVAPGSNAFLGEALTLFRENPTGEGLAPNNAWLFANLELRRVASALSLRWDLPAELPWLTLGVTGDGKTVHTRAQLNFAKPLPFELEPWNIPTNLIHDPLVSFTAIQGLQPWLSSSKLWRSLDLGTPPNQLYFWAQSGLNVQSYFAAQMTNAGNFVKRAADRLLQRPNAHLASEGIGRFERSTNSTGVVWTGVLFAAPYLEPVALTGGDFVFAGLVPNLVTNKPPPTELLRSILGTTNLVAYDWELTGQRLDEWLDFGQLVRFALHLAQVPPKSASLAWLQALVPKLGNCVTAVKRTGPAQLSFTRNSALGFTAAELDLLADWLESPQFPRGLNTFLGEPAPLPRLRASGVAARVSTNSPPTVHH